MNNSNFIGRLTKNPELRFAPSTGTAIAKFTLAVTRDYDRDNSDFINVTAFGKKAETIAQYCTKGSRLYIQANVKTGSYDSQDGTKRFTTDFIVNNFEFLDTKKPTDEFKLSETDFSVVPDDSKNPF